MHIDRVSPWDTFLLGYHNPYNLVNFWRAIGNKIVLILNILEKIKSISPEKLAKPIKHWA
ncbi:hypothetical protein B9S53_21235 [Arthrospira sp. O9.13F]|nr:hypothetical protein B9S53_21235 [Arthrospira sp. O9.13F]